MPTVIFSNSGTKISLMNMDSKSQTNEVKTFKYVNEAQDFKWHKRRGTSQDF